MSLEKPVKPDPLFWTFVLILKFLTSFCPKANQSHKLYDIDYHYYKDKIKCLCHISPFVSSQAQGIKAKKIRIQDNSLDLIPSYTFLRTQQWEILKHELPNWWLVTAQRRYVVCTDTEPMAW